MKRPQIARINWKGNRFGKTAESYTIEDSPVELKYTRDTFSAIRHGITTVIAKKLQVGDLLRWDGYLFDSKPKKVVVPVFNDGVKTINTYEPVCVREPFGQYDRGSWVLRNVNI